MALAFYRAPSRYAELRNPRVPLPAGVGELLAAQSRALADKHIDDTAARLGATPGELRAAQLFFIKQALLEAGGDHYRTLGADRDADSGQLRQHYHYLMRLFHPDRDVDSEGWDNLYAPAVNAAWNTLRVPARRQAYDATLSTPDELDAVLAAGSGTPGRGAEAVGGGNRRPVKPGGWRDRLAAWIILTPGRMAVIFLGAAVLLFWWVPDWGPGDNNLRITQEKTGETQGGPTAISREEKAPVPFSPATSPVAEADREAALEAHIRERLAAAENAVGGRRPPRTERQPRAQRQPEPASTREAASTGKVASTGTVASTAEAASAIPLETAAVDVRESGAPSVSPESPAASVSPESSTALDQPRIAATPPAAQDSSDSIPTDRTPTDRTPTDTASADRTSPDSIPTDRTSPDSTPAADPPAPVPPLDKDQLTALLNAFVTRYEAGDAERFGKLFSDDADTTDARGRQAITRLYADFFARPESRNIRFSRMRWEHDGGWRSRGSGRARVETRSLESGEHARGELLMTFLVEQTPEGPRITGLYYR